MTWLMKRANGTELKKTYKIKMGKVNKFMEKHGKYVSSTYGVWMDILDEKVTSDNELVYLLDFEGDECYLIVGGGEYEHAELSKSLFCEDMAREVFRML